MMISRFGVEYGKEEKGANIAGVIKVADVMLVYGVI